MDERTLAPPARAGVNIRAIEEPISLLFSLYYGLMLLTSSTRVFVGVNKNGSTYKRLPLFISQPHLS